LRWANARRRPLSCNTALLPFAVIPLLLLLIVAKTRNPAGAARWRWRSRLERYPRRAEGGGGANYYHRCLHHCAVRHGGGGVRARATAVPRCLRRCAPPRCRARAALGQRSPSPGGEEGRTVLWWRRAFAGRGADLPHFTRADKLPRRISTAMPAWAFGGGKACCLPTTWRTFQLSFYACSFRLFADT